MSRKNDRFDNNIYPFYYISHGLSYYLPFLQKQKKPPSHKGGFFFDGED
jgi:hypothetical protein